MTRRRHGRCRLLQCTGFVAAARELKDKGTFGYVDTALPSAKLAGFMRGNARRHSGGNVGSKPFVIGASEYVRSSIEAIVVSFISDDDLWDEAFWPDHPELGIPAMRTEAAP